MRFLNKIIPVNITNKIGLCGMTDEFFCAYVSKLYSSSNNDILILTSTLFEANMIFNTLKNYTDKVFLFPMDDFLTTESIAMSPDLKTARLDTLNEIIKDSNNIVVCHLDSFLRYLPTKNKYINSKINLKQNQEIDRFELSKRLLEIGYNRETIVTNTGEIGIRGFVIDIYPINYTNPIRIEFFGDTIESIRTFDSQTQKSLTKLDEIIISPNTEFLVDKEIPGDLEPKQKYLPYYSLDYCNIMEYLKKPIFIVKDYSQILASYKRQLEEMFEYKIKKDSNYNGNYMFDFNTFNFNDCIYYNTINNMFENIEKENIYDLDIKRVPQFNENIEAINSYIENQLYKKNTIIICLKEFQIKSLTKYLKHKYIITNDDEIFENKVNLIDFPMNEGYIYGKYIFLTAKELFNKTNQIKYKSKFKYTSKIKSISNIEIGDYVVHSTHGIGVYNGIKTLIKNNLKKDYLEILYSGSDKLYIPVEKIELIGKFTGKEGIVPKINKLGSTDWQRTKLRVKNRVQDIAKNLLELYAKRKTKKGFSFNKDDELQLLFDSQFQFSETPDQLRAIEQIKNDMHLDIPMDRLLCGDVGYGKTEVAFRAMFKAVNSSKQVLYLCPTTILSNQQYNSAKSRFSGFPVNIELINRFTSPKKSKQIIEDLSSGKIDILFGTHRLLSPDIKPKDLGLLVIDEEQRFGVKHKEKIKEYKENIDVLTLTATPIPRTLQMSLLGLRSLSLIETPPVDRFPIQTYVIEENSSLVRDAIYKEMARNGQVFVLYNNVKRIEEKLNEIKTLVPEARVVYAHGQLNKCEIEEKMLDFIAHKYDVMVCTTIIETGIDINNVNTLIIYDADKFGLSQLYQIRGRVGRSNKIAYSYLMYKKEKILNEVAIKRLQAIREFTELGSGFSIASRDLSIRGAGDILGSEQAGFIDSIGIDLYLKILNEEVERLRGNAPLEFEKDINSNLINVQTHISDDYVKEEELKIEIHKLINTITTFDELNSVKTELEDRFGKLNEDILIYMYEEWFEALAKKLNVYKVIQNNRFIQLNFNSEISSKMNMEEIFANAIKISDNFSFSYKDSKLIITLNILNIPKHYIYYLTELLNSIDIMMSKVDQLD